MGKGPSGNTTTTVQNQNPVANAQLPFLQDLWGSAVGLARQPSPNTIGANQGYAQAQADTTAPIAANVMPTAIQQYIQQIQRGNPSQAQADLLTANAAGAVNQGLGFSQALADRANNLWAEGGAFQNLFANDANTANNVLQGYGTAATGALTGLAPGALGGLSSLSGRALTAGSPAEGGLYGNAAAALANPALASGLTGLASGRYIDPSTNPAYAGMIKAATEPLINQYQTATAPQVASQFERGGRYGSGAATNAMGQAQYGLGQGLASAIAPITNNAYSTGINATLGAGQALGNIYNTGVGNITSALGTAGGLGQADVQNAGTLLNQGYNTAGNLLNQGYTTGGNLAQAGFNTRNAILANAGNIGLGYLNAGLTGLGAGANAAQSGYGTANTALTGAGNLLNLGSGALTNALGQAGGFGTYPESQYTAAYNAPWLPYSNLSGILGGAVGGTGTQTTTQPYYSNTAANVVSGLTGGLGLLKFLAA